MHPNSTAPARIPLSARLAAALPLCLLYWVPTSLAEDKGCARHNEGSVPRHTALALLEATSLPQAPFSA
jgi:hypothetical protein